MVEATVRSERRVLDTGLRRNAGVTLELEIRPNVIQVIFFIGG